MIAKRKSGSAWVGILLLLVFITSLGLAIVVDSINTITQSKKSAQIIVAQSLCDAGIEKTIWELNKNSSYAGEENYVLPTGEIDISITGDFENKNVLITSYIPNEENAKTQRTVRARIVADNNESSFSFHYGIQVGETGLTMSNNSQVVGSVYSGGSITGGSGVYIKGDVYISKPDGELNNVRVGCPASQGGACPINGSAHVYNLIGSYIYGDGYYTNRSSTTILGTATPNSPAPAPISLPISDTNIDLWKSWAEKGGLYTGNYTLSGNNVSVDLGPYKIDGDLTITNGSTLNLTGVLYVTGDITFSQNAIISLDSSFGTNSGMIIADGTVITSNNVQIKGSGNSASYIMILSTSSSDPAINVANNSSSVVYYANNGFIDVANNAHIRSITGKGIRLKNGAIVEYDTGLANSNFSAGPGGSWFLKEWQVVH